MVFTRWAYNLKYLKCRRRASASNSPIIFGIFIDLLSCTSWIWAFRVLCRLNLNVFILEKSTWEGVQREFFGWIYRMPLLNSISRNSAGRFFRPAYSLLTKNPLSPVVLSRPKFGLDELIMYSYNVSGLRSLLAPHLHFGHVSHCKSRFLIPLSNALFLD